MTIDPRRGLLAGGLCLVLSIALVETIPVLFGTPQPMVHVIWRDADHAEREALEHRFHLSEAAELSGGRWAYVPQDTTREALRALVRHPKVADTDGIDRNLFRMAANAPLTNRRGGRIVGMPWAPRVFKLLAGALAAAGVVFLVVAAHARGWVRRDALQPSVLGRGIPVASAEAAGIFRIAFGCLVLVYLVRNPVYPDLLNPYELGRAVGPYGSLMRWLGEHEDVVLWIDPAVKAFGGLFILGIGTTITYMAFVATFLVWASVYTLNISHHVVAALGIAMICLIPSRWGDAWSFDAWRASRIAAGHRSPASKRYGYAMWVPVFVLGVTLAAAAASKLRGGLDWIFNGTVKYHFVSDLEHAWVPWGPRLMRHDALAVPVSAVTVVLEALVLTAVFSRSDRYRLIVGLCVAAMLAGFAVFQGIVWPGWWILLVGFLPWHRIQPASALSAVGATSFAQRAVLSAVVLFQIYAWSARIEARPIISSYDMYATTYASDEEYELASNLTYRVLAINSGGAAQELGCDVDDEAARVLTAAARGGSVERTRMRSILTRCLGRRREVQYVLLEGDRQVFDWQTGRFGWKRGVDRIGPVSVGWLWQ